MPDNLAPIAFFAFNRPDHTRRSLEAIAGSELADRSKLYALCDGPRVEESDEGRARIEEVRQVILERPWCRDVVTRFSPANRGLAASLLTGIGEIVAEHGRVIVIEDDVVVAPGFLQFMNETLELYADEPSVMHVSGYSPFFSPPEKYEETSLVLNHTYVGWGWATWRRAWEMLSTDGAALRRRIDALGNRHYVNLDGGFEIYWALKALDEGRSQDWNAYWHASVLVNGGVCIHPVISLADNIGMDGSGTHCSVSDRQMLRPTVDRLPIRRIELVERSEHRRVMTGRPFRIRAEILLKHWARRIVFGAEALARRWRPD